jgi:hypothetical protein
MVVGGGMDGLEVVLVLVLGGDRVAIIRDRGMGRERIGISALSCRVDECHFCFGGGVGRLGGGRRRERGVLDDAGGWAVWDKGLALWWWVIMVWDGMRWDGELALCCIYPFYCCFHFALHTRSSASSGWMIGWVDLVYH